MNLLKTNLEELYQKKYEAEDIFPLEKTFEALNSFINSEILSGHQFINPYRFASSSGMELGKALVLLMFIGSSVDNRILTIKYKYTCSNLNDSFLSEKELENFQCDEDCDCDEEMNLKEDLENGDIDLNIYFEIDNQLKNYIIDFFHSNTNKSFKNSNEREVTTSLHTSWSEIDKNEENVGAFQMLVSSETSLSRNKRAMALTDIMRRQNKGSN